MTESSPIQAGYFKNSIARRLILYIILFSSVITLVGTSLQLYFDYSEDINFIKDSMHQVKTSHLHSIINNLWVSDSEQIEAELISILTLPDMQHIKIVKDEKILYSYGIPQTDKIISQYFPLDYSFKDKRINLGTLQVVASLNGVYQRLYGKVLVILTTQAIKTFLVSFFILFLFYFLVGRHLLVVAKYAKTLDLDHLDIPLVISRRIKKLDGPDELTTVVKAINSMRINLKLDIDVRSKIEEELRESHALLDAIFEGTTDAIFLKDLEGCYLQANKATLQAMGKSKEEVIGKSDAELFPQMSAQVINEIDASIFESGKTIMVEERLETAYGDTYWLTNKSPFRDSNKTIVGLIGISRNITKLKETEAEKTKLEDLLRHAQKMEAIGTLAGGIAHDFNNILAAILGYAEMVNDEVPEASPAKKDIQQVIKAGNRAKDLVKHILAYSRKSEQERTPVAIHLIAEEALKLLRPSIPTTIEILQDIDPECGSLVADPSQIHQVIMNLCTNAAQAMDEKGGILKVSLGCLALSEDDLQEEPYMKPGQYVKLSISDTGPGIDKNDLDRIFDPYFTTKEVGKGSGMGLAVVHGIVKSHDGMITVDSASGEGATFNVFFPKVAEMGQQKSENNVFLPTGNERILVVDDDESVAEMTKRRLERLGYQVTSETDSTTALELFRSQPHAFDLVLTDQTMPNMTGEQLASELTSIQSDIPIILCTGYSSQIDAEKAGLTDISAFIMKPVDKNELASIIRQVLNRKTSPG